MDDVDSVEQKLVCGVPFYFLGATESSAFGIPSSWIKFDEVDLYEGGHENFAAYLQALRGRQAHSEVKVIELTSNPTLPGKLIDSYFAQSDQKHWLVKCRSCGRYVDLLGTFPECLHRRRDGTVVRRCTATPGCDGEPDIADGLWVPACPGKSEWSGWQYTQLWVHDGYVSPKSILDAYETALQSGNPMLMQRFENTVLGRPWVASENALTVDEVLGLCREWSMWRRSREPCFLGADVGSHRLHVVVGTAPEPGADHGRVVYCGEATWDGLRAMMADFGVATAVIDAQPEYQKALEFAQAYAPGRAWLCRYLGPGEPQWKQPKREVHVSRLYALDEATAAIRGGRDVLPARCPEVEMLAKHLAALRRQERRDKSGNLLYEYDKVGDDHLAHAYGYMRLARDFAMKNYFSECDLS